MLRFYEFPQEAKVVFREREIVVASSKNPIRTRFFLNRTHSLTNHSPDISEMRFNQQACAIGVPRTIRLFPGRTLLKVLRDSKEAKLLCSIEQFGILNFLTIR